MRETPITHTTDHGTIAVRFDAHGLTLTVNGFAETVIVDVFEGEATVALSNADDETIASHKLTKGKA